RLMLVGRLGQSTDEIRRTISDAGLEDRVLLPGFVDDDDLPALLGGARLFVHPAVDEGFGLPPLEAMAAGAPVVTSNAGSLPEIGSDAGEIVDATSMEAWADAIDRVANSDALRRQLSEAGRARAATFTWERAARETIAVHQSVIDG